MVYAAELGRLVRQRRTNLEHWLARGFDARESDDFWRCSACDRMVGPGEKIVYMPASARRTDPSWAIEGLRGNGFGHFSGWCARCVESVRLEERPCP